MNYKAALVDVIGAIVRNRQHPTEREIRARKLSLMRATLKSLSTWLQENLPDFMKAISLVITFDLPNTGHGPELRNLRKIPERRRGETRSPPQRLYP
jgi:hypothetical protein